MDTRALILFQDDFLVSRVCESCGWCWDQCQEWLDHGAQMLTPRERIAKMEAK